VALLCVRFVKTKLYEIAKVDAGMLAVAAGDTRGSGICGWAVSGTPRSLNLSYRDLKNGIALYCFLWTSASSCPSTASRWVSPFTLSTSLRNVTVMIASALISNVKSG